MAFTKRKSDFRLAKLSWDFSIGKVVVEDRVKGSDGAWANENLNIDPDKFRAVADMPNMLFGWIAFIRGEGLNAMLKPLGEDYGDRPSKEHREGLRLILVVDGVIRELISTAKFLWDALDALHSDYLTGVKEHKGQLPVIGIESVREEQGRDAPVFIPTFKIVEWAQRPADLPEAGISLVWRAKRYDKQGNAQSTKDDMFTRPKVEDDRNDILPF